MENNRIFFTRATYSELPPNISSIMTTMFAFESIMFNWKFCGYNLPPPLSSPASKNFQLNSTKTAIYLHFNLGLFMWMVAQFGLRRRKLLSLLTSLFYWWGCAMISSVRVTNCETMNKFKPHYFKQDIHIYNLRSFEIQKLEK